MSHSRDATSTPREPDALGKLRSASAYLEANFPNLNPAELQAVLRNMAGAAIRLEEVEAENEHHKAMLAARSEIAPREFVADIIDRINEFGLHPDLTNEERGANACAILEDCRGVLQRLLNGAAPSATRTPSCARCGYPEVE